MGNGIPRQVSLDQVRKVADSPQARREAEVFCGLYLKLLALASLDEGL